MNTCKQQSINSFMTQVFLRTETSPLICSANQWAGFCNRGLRHKRFKMLFIHIHRESALTYCKAQFAFFVLVLFSVFFFSKISTIHRTSGEGGDYLLIFFQTLPSASQTLRHQLGYCCRELTSAHSWQPELHMKSLVHAFWNSLFYTCTSSCLC